MNVASCLVDGLAQGAFLSNHRLDRQQIVTHLHDLGTRHRLAVTRQGLGEIELEYPVERGPKGERVASCRFVDARLEAIDQQVTRDEQPAVDQEGDEVSVGMADSGKENSNRLAGNQQLKLAVDFYEGCDGSLGLQALSGVGVHHDGAHLGVQRQTSSMVEVRMGQQQPASRFHELALDVEAQLPGRAAKLHVAHEGLAAMGEHQGVAATTEKEEQTLVDSTLVDPQEQLGAAPGQRGDARQTEHETRHWGAKRRHGGTRARRAPKLHDERPKNSKVAGASPREEHRWVSDFAEEPPTSPSVSPLQSAMRRVNKLNSVLEVAKAMTAAHHLDSLLPLIMKETARVVEADRCSLFILDRKNNELFSRVAQGATGEIRLPVGQGSLAGSVAQSGQVVNLKDAYADPRFNREWDAKNGYRTSSVLCVPMRNARGEVTGVIQALNSVHSGFDAEDEELMLALGGQAAQAIENAMLHEEINSLFEGFVQASVGAIESRDPTTAGHSGRVAALTVFLAQTTEKVPSGPYKGLAFTADQLQEIRYASLLHDFGKIGVREPVLVKAEKLYPHELDLLKQRFELARRDRQLASLQRRLDALKIRGEKNIEEIDAEEKARLDEALKELDEAFEFVLTANRPTVLAQGGFERLSGLSNITFADSREVPQVLLTPNEVQVLSIPRGSLSAAERREIESHVTHTFRFLSQIPWTRTLRRVPEIAYAHHEKLDGKGYPRAIAVELIPVQSKMMAIADIYDALTASDRPYKKAVPHTLALDILHKEAASGQLDPELLKIFTEAEIPKLALKK